MNAGLVTSQLIRTLPATFGAVIFALPLAVVSDKGIASERQPNIVFIMADDMGWADVEFHGGSVPTPNLNELLASGVELTQHYAAPVCSPTRTGLLSGRFWSRFGVTTPTNNKVFSEETVTLPKALQSSGYETCLTGKWHLGSKPEWGPNHFGFQHSYGSLAGGVGPYAHLYKKGKFTQTWHRNETYLKETGHVTDLITDEAVRWIEERGDTPFFLYVPYTAVHLPVQEDQHWVEKAAEHVDGELQSHYGACIMHLDEAVGRIVTAIDDKEIRSNTLIVFTSDNGASVSENNDTRYPGGDYPAGPLPGNNAPLRGKKGQLYEGGIRVPTIVNWTSRFAPGTVDVPTIISDWMPTLCELANFSSPEELQWDGTSFLSLLDRRTGFRRMNPLYLLGPMGRSRALRDNDWKLVIHDRRDGQLIELFNIAEDENEATNLAEKYPDKVAYLLYQLEEASTADSDMLVQSVLSDESGR